MCMYAAVNHFGGKPLVKFLRDAARAPIATATRWSNDLLANDRMANDRMANDLIRFRESKNRCGNVLYIYLSTCCMFCLSTSSRLFPNYVSVLLQGGAPRGGGLNSGAPPGKQQR